MITRITRVRNYRGLREWSCDGGVDDFAAINVVYGFNGSGKSTLCSLLREARADEGWETGLELEVTDTGTKRTVHSSSDPFWQRIRVFNRDYVEGNLRFDEVDPTAVPLLVLGEPDVEIESRRAQLQSLLDDVDGRMLELQREKISADDSRAALLKTAADTIVGELQHLGGRYHPRSFNAGTVRRRLADGFTAPPIDTDVNILLGVVREQQLGPVTIPSRTMFSLDRMVDEVRAVLAETAASQVIDDLRDHPDWNHWVQEGLVLHGDSDTCIYCTGRIPDERREALAHHFDESLRQLQSRISSMDSELDSERQACARTVASLPADELISSELRAGFYGARMAVGNRANGWMKAIDTLRSALGQKRESLFSPMDLPASPEPLTISLDDLVAILHRHNELVRRFDERRRGAAETIELVHITTIRDQINDLIASSARLEREQSDSLETKRQHQQELASLTADVLEPAPIANELNDDLGRLLGRSDLRFSIAEGQRGYRITRDGRPATHLSEGERNAIALLYFLRSLESHGTELDKCTILIDDPVSSLDRNVLIGMSSHLWYRLARDRKCRQLMLFTHNFELFRHWLIQFDRKDRNRTSNRFKVFEMRRCLERQGDGSHSWRLSLTSLDHDRSLRKHLRSEHHYLFWRIADHVLRCRSAPAIELDLEAASVLPNVCRRLVESFLSFKVPDRLGNITEQLEIAGNGIVDEVTRTRLHTFVDRHSHQEDAATAVGDVDTEGTQILVAVLQFIHAVDRPHFMAMCRAVAVTPSDITAAFIPQAGPST